MEKIAVIDLGSNSARLVLANILEGGYFVVFDELKETVRLGQDMEREGFLKPSRIAQAVKTLKMFKKLIDINNIDKVIAVATSAKAEDLIINGSTTVLPIIQKASETFMKNNPTIVLSIAGGGSGNGGLFSSSHSPSSVEHGRISASLASVRPR